jgi:bacillopeptidase F (M6 metalloprotease family)
MHSDKTRRTRKRFASGLSFDDMVVGWVIGMNEAEGKGGEEALVK